MTQSKNNKRPRRVLVEDGRMLCPYCKGYQGKAYFGASSGGIELMCRNDRCKRSIRLDI
jgi:hypothetical protein